MGDDYTTLENSGGAIPTQDNYINTQYKNYRWCVSKNIYMKKYNLGDINLRVYHYFLGITTELVSVSISEQ